MTFHFSEVLEIIFPSIFYTVCNNSVVPVPKWLSIIKCVCLPFCYTSHLAAIKEMQSFATMENSITISYACESAFTGMGETVNSFLIILPLLLLMQWCLNVLAMSIMGKTVTKLQDIIYNGVILRRFIAVSSNGLMSHDLALSLLDFASFSIIMSKYLPSEQLQAWLSCSAATGCNEKQGRVTCGSCIHLDVADEILHWLLF